MNNSNTTDMELSHARNTDIDYVRAMYRSMIGHPGCTWNELYPDEETLNNDIQNDCLYVLIHNERTIGAISVVPYNELNELTCWQEYDNVSEIARVVIADDYQGHGYAKLMVSLLMDMLKNDGCKAVHLLVSVGNPAAISTYKATGFVHRGESFMYGNNYYAYELIL